MASRQESDQLLKLRWILLKSKISDSESCGTLFDDLRTLLLDLETRQELEGFGSLGGVLCLDLEAVIKSAASAASRKTKSSGP